VGQFGLVRALLQCASCRFSALYFIPFSGGLAAAGRSDAGDALLAAGFWLLLTLGIELTNRLTDRVEDAVNRPERTALCQQIGWERLRRIQALLWLAVAASAAVWLARLPSTMLAALIALGVCAGIGYSRGPRLARRRALVFVVLSGAFVGPFALGWAAGSPSAAATDWRELGRFVPLFWVMTLFVSSLAGIKDITDREGDERIGYRSAFMEFAERHGALALIAVVAAPFVALAGFAAGGALPVRALALVAFLPVSIVVALAVRGAAAAASRLTVREALYHHWLAFTSAALLVCYPSAFLLATVLGGWLFWIFASRHLHWAPALRAADLPTIVRLARVGSVRAPVAPLREGRAWGTS